MKGIAILGFGAEGRATLQFLRVRPEYRDAELWVLDKKPIEAPEDIRSVTGDNYLKSLGEFDMVIRSPGVPYMLPEVQAAIANGVEMSSVTDLFFRHFHGPVIGVTGTKGKGTTSTLIYEMLKADDRDAYLAGNVGTPAIELLPQLSENSIVVLELSSFQLQGLKHSPRYAVVLSLFPDHMDKHADMAEYVEAKGNIAKHQQPGDVVFYVAGNLYAETIAASSAGERVAVDPGSASPPFTPEDLRIVGAHNYQNTVVASVVCRHLGVEDAVISSTIRAFRGLPYRLQFVRELNGVRIYNDSASTNPQTTVAAIRSFTEPVVLIAGGRNKGLDYAPLGDALRDSSVKHVVLFGENKNLLKSYIPDSVSCELAESLINAVGAAIRVASAGDILVFSPGSESLDMFLNYKDRGSQFDKMVRGLEPR